MNNRDEFDDPKSNDFLGSVGPKAAFFIVLIALSFMIGVVWKLYVGGGSSNGKNVPIIRADTQTYKVEPDEPGGMEMPHKDSTIFSSLNSDPDNGIENLLADTDDEEKPMPRSQLFAGLNTEPNSALQTDEVQETPLDKPLVDGQQATQETKSEKVDLLAEPAEEKLEIPKKVEPVQALVEKNDLEVDEESLIKEQAKREQKLIEQAKIEAEKAQALIKEKEAEIAKKAKEAQEKIEKEKIAKEKAAAAAEKAKKAAQEAAQKAEKAKETTSSSAPKVALGTGDYYVQLASVQDRSRAASEWDKLKSKYGSTLSGYKYRVETANLAKGTYYRIQAGPVSKSQATTTCNAIKRKDSNGCLVKKK